MQFVCENSILQKAIAIVEKAISSRTSLALLENIYIELKDKNMTFIGNDLEIAIQYRVPLETVHSEGVILAKAKAMTNIFSKLQNQMVTFNLSENRMVNISTGKVAFDLYSADPKEYPSFPSIQNGIKVILPSEKLKELIKHTLFSVSFDETKHYLNGIFFSLEKDKISFVSTDGYRLSLKTIEHPSEKNCVVIAPFKAMNEVNKIIQFLKPEENVEIILSDNQIGFIMGNTVLVSRVIKGQFPDYQQVIPKETRFRYSVSRRAILEACERATIIASEANNLVKVTFKENELMIRSTASSLGDFQEVIPLTRVMGEAEQKIAFNVKLMLDALKIMDRDDLIIRFNSNESPCVIQSSADDSFMYIIMPIRISDYQEVKEEDKISVS